MSMWRRWVWPGFAATLLLAVAAVLVRSGAVERDLASRVAKGLAGAGQDWATVAISGRRVEIGGTAPTEEAQRLAVEAAAAVSGAGSVADRSQLLALASPYAWSAERSGRKVRISGSVPSEGARNAVLAAARRSLPEAEIIDDMVPARGASPAFGAATAFGLDRLAELSDGLVTITDSVLAIKGTALTAETYRRVRAAIRDSLPRAVTLGPVDITAARAEPFVWSASFDGQSVLLAGYVPNEVVQETLVATARAALPGVAISDETSIASGEPEGFAEAATFAINALGRLREGGVMLDGLTLDMAGEARSVEDYEAIVAGVGAGLPEGLEIVANSITPAVVSPYGWSGRRSGDHVYLTGYVPSLEGRAQLEQAAATAFTGLTVRSDVKIALGEPKMDWIGAIKFALQQLALLQTGSVALGDRTFSIEGEARDSAAFAELIATTTRTLPASLELSSADVVPPRVSPYTFSAVRREGRVMLAGYAPGADEKKELVETAQNIFGGLKIEDDMAFASGAPPDFVAAAVAAMDTAARLAGGRVEILNTKVRVVGEVFFQRAMEEVMAAAGEAMPEGYALDLTIMTRQIGQPLDPAGCRDRLQADLRIGRIEFDGAKATISGKSLGILDRVAGTLLRCGDVAIEVGAHADSDGSASKNRDLTQARAEAVVDYLVDAGVRREQLTAVGYGEDNPIADNSTPEGKAANRRIEFLVQVPDGGEP